MIRLKRAAAWPVASTRAHARPCSGICSIARQDLPIAVTNDSRTRDCRAKQQQGHGRWPQDGGGAEGQAATEVAALQGCSTLAVVIAKCGEIHLVMETR